MWIVVVVVGGEGWAEGVGSEGSGAVAIVGCVAQAEGCNEGGWVGALFMGRRF